MRVTGAATLDQPPGAVWSALNDPLVLTRAIPGCERLDVTGPGACTLTVLAGIAAVAGSYTGEARAVEQVKPGLIRATVSGSGNRGRVGADVTVRLVSSGESATQVSYEADIRASGPVAAVGQLVLASVAGRLAAQFLTGIGAVLAGSPATATPATATSAPATPAEAPTGDAARVAAEPTSATPGAVPPDAVPPQAVPRESVPRESVPRESVPPGAVPSAAGRSADGPSLLPAGAGGRASLAAGAAGGITGLMLGILLGRRARGGRR